MAKKTFISIGKIISSSVSQKGYLIFNIQTQGARSTIIGQTLALNHERENVRDVANHILSEICHAVEVSYFQDTEDLHDIPFIVEYMEVEYNGNLYYEARRYKPLVQVKEVVIYRDKPSLWQRIFGNHDRT